MPLRARRRPVERHDADDHLAPRQALAGDIVLEFDTWSTFEEECGLSRLWGGVHFMAAITAGQALGHRIGNLAYTFINSHINGAVP